MTTQTHIVMPVHANSQQRLFGGQLVAWIDVAAAVEARRYARSAVTTVSIDHLDFIAPAFIDDMVHLEAYITWTGRTSLEIGVDTFVEASDGKRQQINRAYLVFVALSPEGLPTPVPPYQPETDAQRDAWEAACMRREHQKLYHPIDRSDR